MPKRKFEEVAEASVSVQLAEYSADASAEAVRLKRTRELSATTRIGINYQNFIRILHAKNTSIGFFAT